MNPTTYTACKLLACAAFLASVTLSTGCEDATAEAAGPTTQGVATTQDASTTETATSTEVEADADMVATIHRLHTEAAQAIDSLDATTLTLDAGDPQFDTGEFYEVHTFTVAAPCFVEVTLTNLDSTAWMSLSARDGEQVVFEGQGHQSSDNFVWARVLAVPGLTYAVTASTVHPGDTGRAMLTVARSTPIVIPQTPLATPSSLTATLDADAPVLTRLVPRADDAGQPLPPEVTRNRFHVYATDVAPESGNFFDVTYANTTVYNGASLVHFANTGQYVGTAKGEFNRSDRHSQLHMVPPFSGQAGRNYFVVTQAGTHAGEDVDVSYTLVASRKSLTQIILESQ